MSGFDNLPDGFDGTFRCDKHPEREAVAPIALRRCAECMEDAWRSYSDSPGQQPRDYEKRRYQDELSPDGRSIYLDHQGFYRHTLEREDPK